MQLQKGYKSPSTGQTCTSAQYISEVVCTRFIQKTTGGDPGFKFWNKQQKDKYKATITVVNKLMKQYGERNVVRFLSQNTHIYSVGFFHPHAWLHDAIATFIKNNPEVIIEVSKHEEPAEQIIEPTEADMPVRKNKKSLFKRLNNG